MFKDVLRHMDLAAWPVIGLVLFVVAFLGLCAWVAARRRTPHFERMSGLPLEDGTPAGPGAPTRRAPR